MSEQAYRVSICNRSMDGATHLQFSCDFFFYFLWTHHWWKNAFFCKSDKLNIHSRWNRANTDTKGQLISKGLFHSLLPKKTNSGRLVFVCFFGRMRRHEKSKLTELYEHFICTANCTMYTFNSTLCKKHYCEYWGMPSQYTESNLEVLWKFESIGRSTLKRT